MGEMIYIVHNREAYTIEGAYHSLRNAYLACINYYGEEENISDYERIVAGFNLGYHCVSMNNLWIYQAKFND